jgi:hypothetical protein
MEDIKNDDNIEKEFYTYGRDINGRYIMRRRDKCIFGFTVIISVSVFIYNIYLLSNIFHIKT